MSFSVNSASRWLNLFFVLLLALLATFVVPNAAPWRVAFAQDATPAPITVSDDQVNAVAARMYCPSCQGVPLDVCGTQVCLEWREEIRVQLQSGRTEEQIMNDFVTRYGERIVGAPLDPALRAFSLVTPYIIGAFVVLIGIWTVVRRWRSRRLPADYGLPIDQAVTPVKNDDADYRARLEQDLQ